MNARRQDSLVCRWLRVPSDTTKEQLTRLGEALAPLGMDDMPPREPGPRRYHDRGAQRWYVLAAVARSMAIIAGVVALHIAAVKYVFAAIL